MNSAAAIETPRDRSKYFVANGKNSGKTIPNIIATISIQISLIDSTNASTTLYLNSMKKRIAVCT